MYVKAHYLDKITGIPETEAPMNNGPVAPDMTIALVDRRQRPSIIYGTVPDGASLEAGMTEINETEYNGALSEYSNWKSDYEAAQLDKLKLSKKQEIKKDFETDTTNPVTHNAIELHGGEESARRINDKATMLEYAGQTSGQIFDTSDTYHTLTIAEMRAVAFAIAQAYETKLYNYKQLESQVNAATTTAEVEVINYV